MNDDLLPPMVLAGNYADGARFAEQWGLKGARVATQPRHVFGVRDVLLYLADGTPPPEELIREAWTRIGVGHFANARVHVVCGGGGCTGCVHGLEPYPEWKAARVGIVRRGMAADLEAVDAVLQRVPQEA